jgi:hypothetical protein
VCAGARRQVCDGQDLGRILAATVAALGSFQRNKRVHVNWERGSVERGAVLPSVRQGHGGKLLDICPRSPGPQTFVRYAQACGHLSRRPSLGTAVHFQSPGPLLPERCLLGERSASACAGRKRKPIRVICLT